MKSPGVGLEAQTWSPCVAVDAYALATNKKYNNYINLTPLGDILQLNILWSYSKACMTRLALFEWISYSLGRSINELCDNCRLEMCECKKNLNIEAGITIKGKDHLNRVI
jgi:hypothetical protein